MKLATVLERTLVVAIALVFAAPLVLTCLTHWVQPGPSWARWMNHDWLLNRTLRGEDTASSFVPFSWPAFWRAQYQQGVASFFDLNFAGREFIIRAMNESDYRLFRIASSRRDHVVIGKNNWLFQKQQLLSYAFERPVRKDITRIVQKLIRLQKACSQRNVAFAVLISPAKASLYPEKLPDIWRHRYDPRPDAYSIFKQLLKENNVCYVDGVALTKNAKANAPVPVFPRGGGHWSDDASLISTNQLLIKLRDQNARFQPIERESLSISQDPRNIDADLYLFMNLFSPWHYKVGDLKIRSVPFQEKKPPLNVVLVGDSFAREVARQISASKQCEEVVMYFYYKIRKMSYHDEGETRVAEPVPPVNMEREIFAADALIYEANEGNIQNRSLELFLDDALNNLPRVPFPKSSFLHSNWRPYLWDETIDFRLNAKGAERGLVQGFSIPDLSGRWTLGTEARIQLAVSPADCDMILETEVAAFMPGGATPQRAAVFANDKFIGELVFSNSGLQKQKLRIPRSIIDRENLILKFQINHPISPKELGISNDDRKLGLYFSTLQLSPAEKKIDPSASMGSYMPYQWGQEISFSRNSAHLVDPKFIRGFSGSESQITWTNGKQATLRLLVPPATGDLALEAKIGGYFPSDRTDQQAIIYINNQRVGEWSVSSSNPSDHKLVIPQELVGNGGKMLVQFEILLPTSPAETGLGADSRKLGLNFSSLQIHPLPASARR